MSKNFLNLTLNEKWNLIAEYNKDTSIAANCEYFRSTYFSKVKYTEVLLDLEQEFLNLPLIEKGIKIHNLGKDNDYVMNKWVTCLEEASVTFKKHTTYTCKFVLKNSDTESTNATLVFIEGLYYFDIGLFEDKGSALEDLVIKVINRRNNYIKRIQEGEKQLGIDPYN
jgi:hypothetical protein